MACMNFGNFVTTSMQQLLGTAPPQEERVQETSFEQLQQAQPETASSNNHPEEEEKDQQPLSVGFWNKQSADREGVLGGNANIHMVDVADSKAILRSFAYLMPSLGSALDCGAGIGRVTNAVLKPRFRHVDLLEPSLVQLEKARKQCRRSARNFFHKSLQEFDFSTRYDAIWIQWVLMYLTDAELAEFLQRAKQRGLTSNGEGKTGLIFVKENVVENISPEDREREEKVDNSTLRSHAEFVAIFTDGGYTIVAHGIQPVICNNLQEIHWYVLKPKAD